MEKYNKSFVAMHWIHGLAIAFVLVAATATLPDLPKNAADLAPFKGHMIFGAVVTLLTIARIYMISRHQELKALDIGTIRASIVRWNHRLIYLTLLVVGASGVATVKSANIDKVLILGEDPSLYLGPDGITQSFGVIHSVSTTLLMVLIAMHIAGVVSYRLKTKECILKRMWF